MCWDCIPRETSIISRCPFCKISIEQTYKKKHDNLMTGKARLISGYRITERPSFCEVLKRKINKTRLMRMVL